MNRSSVLCIYVCIGLLKIAEMSESFLTCRAGQRLVSQHHSAGVTRHFPSTPSHSWFDPAIRMASSTSDESGTKRKQRRRRKPTENTGDIPVSVDTRVEEDDDATKPTSETISAVEQTSPPPPPPPPAVKPDAVVTLQVQDVRDVVAGRSPRASVAAAAIESASTLSSVSVSSPTPSTKTESVDSEAGDALERLLQDARRMKEVERGRSDTDEGFSIPKTAQSALSTLLTIDFFVVCGFLVWFLAGIVGSYVLQNDSIQIAFNNIFQPIVQPALGLLMIGSIASAVFKEEDKED